MNRSSMALGGLALLVLSATALWLWRPSPNRPFAPESSQVEIGPTGGGNSPLPQSSAQSPEDLRGDLAGEPSGSSPRGYEDGARRSVLGPCEAQRVVGSDGRPLAGVEITWVAVDAACLERSDRERLRLDSCPPGLSTVTDEHGCFAFEANPLGAASRTSVLWASRAGHRADARSVSAGSASIGSGPWLLAEHPAIEVTVTDATGHPVADATLVTVLCDDADEPVESEITPAERATLRRIVHTDAKGQALVPALPGEQCVRVQGGALLSTTWVGRAPARLRLVLHETFTLTGRVVVQDPSLDAGAMTITVRSIASGVPRTLERFTCEPDGSFGPLAIAAPIAEELVVRMEGAGAIPMERRLAMPGAGARIDLRFDAHPGLRAAVRVEDDAGQPVRGAHVEAWWRSGEDWSVCRAQTEFDGVANLDGIALGDVHFVARAAGYSIQRTAVVRLETGVPARYLIEIQRLHRIPGRVVLDGEPAKDFRVLYWDELGDEVRTITVVDSPTGEFEIEGALGSRTMLFASGPGAAPSPTVTVDADGRRDAELVLELARSMAARGRVLDAWTAEPLEAATVHPWAVFGKSWKAPTGPIARCDGKGGFVLEGLAAGENHIAVRAPGYSQAWSAIEVADRGITEVGTFLLARAQDLRVVLEAKDLEVTRCRVGIDELPESDQTFGPEGLAAFEAVTPGDWTVWVELPDGTRLEQFVYLSSGRPWVVRFEAGGEHRAGLEVHVVSDRPIPEGLRVRSITGLGTSWTRRRSVPVASGHCRIPGPLGEELTLSIWDPFQQLLAVRHVGSEELRTGRVEIALQGLHRTIRVLDARREPLARVRAVLTVEGDRSQWRGWGDTGGDGRVTLAVPPRTPLVLHLMLPGGGAVPDLRVDTDADPDSDIEVIVDPPGALEVRYHDGGAPLPSVASSLISASGFRCAYLSFSDADGRARVSSLAPGRYILDVPHPGVWPLQVPIEIGTELRILEVQLRRLGQLVLEVRSADGAALPGARLLLVHSEFGGDVGLWIAEARVPAPPIGLVTDPAGRVRLTGIPSGPYYFRLLATDGRELTGHLTVPPHGEGSVYVVFP